MRAEYWAICTALCWAVGALFEKHGVKIGGLAPVMGTTVRTAVSLLFLLLVSQPYWIQLKTAGFKSLSLIGFGGGIVAGGLGITFLYTALKSGDLGIVLMIAFCLTPVIGAILGYFVLQEKPHAMQILGGLLCIVGATLVTYFKTPG